MKKIKNMNRFAKNSIFSYSAVIIFYLVMQVLISGGHIGNALKGQLIPICVYVVMAVSLNLVVGISGELSLGHAGFMSLGAFTGVVVAGSLGTVVESKIVVLALSMIVGALVAGFFGVLIGIPVLRLKGDYLAIVTLAFGEIIKDIVTLIYCGIDENGLHFSFKNQASLGLAEGGKVLLGGPMGAVGVTKLSTFTAGIILVLVTLFIVYNLCNSRTGRAIMAVRDNGIAAQSVGINTTKYRMIAFGVASALAGAAGTLYGLNFSSFAPSKFNFNTSILILVFVVLGGMGNIFGSVVAAALLYVLPELLRSAEDYRMLIYAIVLILVMLLRNNETLRSFTQRFSLKKKKAAKEVGANE